MTQSFSLANCSPRPSTSQNTFCPGETVMERFPSIGHLLLFGYNSIQQLVGTSWMLCRVTDALNNADITMEIICKYRICNVSITVLFHPIEYNSSVFFFWTHRQKFFLNAISGDEFLRAKLAWTHGICTVTAVRFKLNPVYLRSKKKGKSTDSNSRFARIGFNPQNKSAQVQVK
jgi:hypothetical protein